MKFHNYEYVIFLLRKTLLLQILSGRALETAERGNNG